MRHGRMGEASRGGGRALVRATSSQSQLSSSISEPAFPSRPGITLSTAQRRGWEERSHAQHREHGEHRAFPAVSTVVGWPPAGFYVWRWRCLLCLSR
jgi:hypothetical protein